MEGNIQEESDVVLDSNLAKVSVSFPNFLNTSFAGGGGTAEHIRKHYEQDGKVKELLNEFTIKDEAWKNFKQRKITIFVEPMIAITNKINEPNSTYAFTCAEAGLLERAGYVYRYENSIPKYAIKEEIIEKVPFEKRILGYSISTHERLYKALPYGSFKDRPEYITMIPNYTGTVGLNGANSGEMIDRLGCFEITAATISEIATPCTIKFHPNGKYFGIDSNIDEKYSIKDINVGDEIKIIKTYEDNYFNTTITDEHTYNSYSFKINNKGEAEGDIIIIDSEFNITEDMLNKDNIIILYCVWNKLEATTSNTDLLTHDGYILYEDELSYVYTYQNHEGDADNCILNQKNLTLSHITLI